MEDFILGFKTSKTDTRTFFVKHDPESMFHVIIYQYGDNEYHDQTYRNYAMEEIIENIGSGRWIKIWEK